MTLFLRWFSRGIARRTFPCKVCFEEVFEGRAVDPVGRNGWRWWQIKILTPRAFHHSLSP